MNFRKSIIIAAISGLTLSAGWAAETDTVSPGSPPVNNSDAKNPIMVGLEVPFSGDYASYGQGYERGIKSWINKNGPPTINGREVQIKKIDTQCDVATGLAAFRREARTLTALFGPSCSAIVSALTPLVRVNRVPTLFFGHAASVTSAYEEGWLFRVSQPDSANQYAFAQYLLPKWKKKGITKLGLIHDTSTTDAKAAESWQRAADDNGMNMVAEPFNLGKTDFTSEILKLKRAGAEAVILQVFGPSESRIIRQMGRLNVNVPIASAEDTPYKFVVNKQTGPSIEGVWFYSDYIHGWEKAQNFEEAFHRLYPDRTPKDIEYEGWMAMKILMRALKKPGAAVDPVKLKEALHNVNIPQGSVNNSFLANGDQKITYTFVGQINNMKADLVEVLEQQRGSFPDWDE